MIRPTLRLLSLKKLPIFKQLQIEEALLRVSKDNWCILNEGSPPAVVMGISGKAGSLIFEGRAEALSVPVIKRFSGGGTVVVDENTLFASFIMNEEDSTIPAFPDQVHCWAKGLYKDVFASHPFRLRENDYVFGDQKFGGNAQYLRKGRWLHHTTFLWDYAQGYMDLLKLPEKRPNYRGARSHEDFLYRLKEIMPEREELFHVLVNVLDQRYQLDVVSVEEVLPYLDKEHRKATIIVTKEKTPLRGA